MREDGRIVPLDFVRCALIALMASSHAIGLSGVGPDSFWTSQFWLPRGWATEAFITLSGLTAAVVLDWDTAQLRTARMLRRRSWHLLVVMFLSNVVLLATKHLALHQFDKLMHADWWIGLVTLRTEYSISGVLLPTSLLLLLLPGLNRLCGRFGTWLVAALITTCAIAAQFGMQSHVRAIAAVMSFGAGFPVIPMMTKGAIGFVCGRALRDARLTGTRIFESALLPIAFIMALPLVVTESGFHRALTTLLPAARVLAFTLTAALLWMVPLTRGLTKPLVAVGRFPLLSFLGHRVIMNTTVILSTRLHAFGPAQLYGACMVFTFAILWALCYYRAHHEALDRMLKGVYL